jgi:hypothetical protein
VCILLKLEVETVVELTYSVHDGGIHLSDNSHSKTPSDCLYSFVIPFKQFPTRFEFFSKEGGFNIGRNSTNLTVFSNGNLPFSINSEEKGSCSFLFSWLGEVIPFSIDEGLYGGLLSIQD